MTNSISELLHNKNFDEPPEVQQIKKFVRDNFSSDCQVDIRPRNYVITVVGASLAGALRMRLHELQKQLKTAKKLVIRIRY
jgi:hypothetical protein